MATTEVKIMTASSTNVQSLVDEYSTFVKESLKVKDDLSSVNWGVLESHVSKWCEWTPYAAQILVELARNNGAFMLRNALALSIALEIEDGEYGF